GSTCRSLRWPRPAFRAVFLGCQFPASETPSAGLGHPNGETGMPRFPEDEPSIFALGQAIIGGARAAAADFRDCPITGDELEARFRRSKAADLAAVEADAFSRTCHAAKDREIAEMLEAMSGVVAAVL